MKKGLFYYMLIACLCACQKKAETISTASLLKEMVDCEALAKYPEPPLLFREPPDYQDKNAGFLYPNMRLQSPKSE